MGKVHKVIEDEEDCVFKSSMKVMLLRERFVKNFKNLKIFDGLIASSPHCRGIHGMFEVRGRRRSFVLINVLV